MLCVSIEPASTMEVDLQVLLWVRSTILRSINAAMPGMRNQLSRQRSWKTKCSGSFQDRGNKRYLLSTS